MIQALCGFSVFEVYDNGFLHTVHEIEEQEWAQISRDAHGAGFAERYGQEEHRNYFWRYQRVTDGSEPFGQLLKMRCGRERWERENAKYSEAKTPSISRIPQFSTHSE